MVLVADCRILSVVSGSVVVTAELVLVSLSAPPGEAADPVSGSSLPLAEEDLQVVVDLLGSNDTSTIFDDAFIESYGAPEPPENIVIELIVPPSDCGDKASSTGES